MTIKSLFGIKPVVVDKPAGKVNYIEVDKPGWGWGLLSKNTIYYRKQNNIETDSYEKLGNYQEYTDDKTKLPDDIIALHTFIDKELEKEYEYTPNPSKQELYTKTLYEKSDNSLYYKNKYDEKLQPVSLFKISESYILKPKSTGGVRKRKVSKKSNKSRKSRKSNKSKKNRK
jgi:hypothetical protein